MVVKIKIFAAIFSCSILAAPSSPSASTAGSDAASVSAMHVEITLLRSQLYQTQRALLAVSHHQQIPYYPPISSGFQEIPSTYQNFLTDPVEQNLGLSPPHHPTSWTRGEWSDSEWGDLDLDKIETSSVESADDDTNTFSVPLRRCVSEPSISLDTLSEKMETLTVDEDLNNLEEEAKNYNPNSDELIHQVSGGASGENDEFHSLSDPESVSETVFQQQETVSSSVQKSFSRKSLPSLFWTEEEDNPTLQPTDAGEGSRPGSEDLTRLVKTRLEVTIRARFSHLKKIEALLRDVACFDLGTERMRDLIDNVIAAHKHSSHYPAVPRSLAYGLGLTGETGLAIAESLLNAHIQEKSLTSYATQLHGVLEFLKDPNSYESVEELRDTFVNLAFDQRGEGPKSGSEEDKKNSKSLNLLSEDEDVFWRRTFKAGLRAETLLLVDWVTVVREFLVLGRVDPGSAFEKVFPEFPVLAETRHKLLSLLGLGLKDNPSTRSTSNSIREWVESLEGERESDLKHLYMMSRLDIDFDSGGDRKFLSPPVEEKPIWEETRKFIRFLWGVDVSEDNDFFTLLQFSSKVEGQKMMMDKTPVSMFHRNTGHSTGSISERPWAWSRGVSLLERPQCEKVAALAKHALYFFSLHLWRVPKEAKPPNPSKEVFRKTSSNAPFFSHTARAVTRIANRLILSQKQKNWSAPVLRQPFSFSQVGRALKAITVFETSEFDKDALGRWTATSKWSDLECMKRKSGLITLARILEQSGTDYLMMMGKFKNTWGVSTFTH